MKVPQFAIKWFLVAFLLHGCITLGLHLWSVQQGFGGFHAFGTGGDPEWYWNRAQSLELRTHNIYPYILAGTFWIIGPNFFFPKLLNVFATSLSVYVGILIAWQLSDKKTRALPAFVGSLLTLYPSLILYSHQISRDALIVLFGLFAFYSAVRWVATHQRIYVFYFVIALGVLAGLRPYMALAVAVISLLYAMWNLKVRRISLIILLFLAIGAALQFAGFGWFGLTYIQHYSNIELLVDFRERAYTRGGSTAEIFLDITSPIAFIGNYFYSSLTVMLGPFPWQIHRPLALFVFFEAIIMWIALAFAFPDLLPILRGRIRKRHILLFLALLLIGMIGLISDNIGANKRLRLLAWSCLFIYIGLAWESCYVKVKKTQAFVKSSEAPHSVSQ